MFRGLKKALLIVTISATLGGGFGIILPSTLSGDATPTAQAATTPKYYVAKVKKSKVVYQINVKKNTIKKYSTIKKGKYIYTTYNSSLKAWIILATYKNKKITSTNTTIYCVQGKASTWMTK